MKVAEARFDLAKVVLWAMAFWLGAIGKVDWVVILLILLSTFSVIIKW